MHFPNTEPETTERFQVLQKIGQVLKVWTAPEIECGHAVCLAYPRDNILKIRYGLLYDRRYNPPFGIWNERRRVWVALEANCVRRGTVPFDASGYSEAHSIHIRNDVAV